MLNLISLRDAFPPDGEEPASGPPTDWIEPEPPTDGPMYDEPEPPTDGPAQDEAEPTSFMPVR